ncbi:MAG TPA: DUF885 domain-containing protein [Terriglobales bacterium]
MISACRVLCCVLILCALGVAQQKLQDKPAEAPAWVKASDANTKLLIDLHAKFNPEQAAYMGVSGIDEQIMDVTPGFTERRQTALQSLLEEFKKREVAEKDPLVKQDLDILIHATSDEITDIRLDEKYLLPYVDMSRMVFLSMKGLLDEQIPDSRTPASVVRLRRYAGLEKGYQPVTKLLEARLNEKLNNPALLGPYKGELELDLKQANSFLDGAEALLKQRKVAGYEQPLAELRKQVNEYDDFLRAQLLPRARTDYRIPAEVYAQNLVELGIDIPPAELARQAHGAFLEIQEHMQTIAAEVAKQRGFASSDYRDVIRELKKQQLVGDAILPHYKERLKNIEEIIRREHLVTLPTREARIVMASEAETASQPAPHMTPPRLLGNTGEAPTFVLPLNVPPPVGETKPLTYDDFTFDAASWTLTAHEARPGHELQFSSMIEHGVSNARALFAFNSTNVEGWGLYSEAILFPYMPKDGQLISLQHRLMRAARAFLDPELQAGKITTDQAYDVLQNEVMLSRAMAKQEVDRYTFRMPGQACSYFYGYTRLMNLRREVEKKQGKEFNAQRFHDFVLAQGLLPPDLMRKAVETSFLTAAH